MRSNSARPLPLLGTALLIVGMIAITLAPASRAGETSDHQAGRSTLAAAGACVLPPPAGTAAPATSVLLSSDVTPAGDDEAFDHHIQRCGESASSGVIFDGPRITEC